MKVLALLVALVGMVLTIGPVGGGQPLGIVLALTSASIYAAYILVGSRLSGQAGAVASATVILPAAAVGSGVLAALHGPALPHTLEGWAAIVAIALVSTVLPIVTFFAGLGRVGPSTAAILSTVEPVVTVLLAMLFLHETMGPLQVVGGLCILGAVVALARSDAAQAREGP
jgi:drug/metabolite transporter (DMT)-like permease